VILITGVFDAEVQPFFESIMKLEVGNLLERRYVRGVVGHNEIVVTSGFVGKVEAAMVTQAFIDKFHPGMVIHVGACGGVSDKLKIGDLVLATEVVEYDVYPTYRMKRFKSSVALSERIINQAPDVYIGILATGDKLVSDPKLKKWVAENTDAVALDMDSAAVAKVATANGVEFGVFKIVVDLCDEKAEEDFNEYFPRYAMIPAVHIMELLKHHVIIRS